MVVIPRTPICVDQWIIVPGVRLYFLTHMHAGWWVWRGFDVVIDEYKRRPYRVPLTHMESGPDLLLTRHEEAAAAQVPAGRGASGWDNFVFS